MTYEVKIDFDGASKSWKENKIKLLNGCYEYKKTQCVGITKNGRQCKKMTKHEYCTMHKK
jgi:hypothetical protein